MSLPSIEITSPSGARQVLYDGNQVPPTSRDYMEFRRPLGLIVRLIPLKVQEASRGGKKHIKASCRSEVQRGLHMYTNASYKRSEEHVNRWSTKQQIGLGKRTAPNQAMRPGSHKYKRGGYLMHGPEGPGQIRGKYGLRVLPRDAYNLGRNCLAYSSVFNGSSIFKTQPRQLNTINEEPHAGPFSGTKHNQRESGSKDINEEDTLTVSSAARQTDLFHNFVGNRRLSFLEYQLQNGPPDHWSDRPRGPVQASFLEKPSPRYSSSDKLVTAAIIALLAVFIGSIGAVNDLARRLAGSERTITHRWCRWHDFNDWK